MATIITGLFQNQSQSGKIAADLLEAGISEEQFIIYRHEYPVSKEIKTSIWQSFFKDKTKLGDESLVVSVKANELGDQEKVKKIFSVNDVIHQNCIHNIKFKHAESLQYLRRIVALRAKSEIYNSPQIRHRNSSPGMNSEVFIGKN